jgi:uncharacterized SAM-binding protein YcdF (DUF218 family)
MSGRFHAIVVLGAPPHPDGSASPAMVRRVRHGVRALTDGAADVLILTGGPARHAVPEAHLMRALALEAGVAPERILVEDQSTRTLENAAYTARLMKGRGLTRALIVSDPCHLPRALLSFRWFGVEAEGSGAPGFWREGPWWSRALIALREVAALAGYLVLLRRYGNLKRGYT